MIWLIIGLVLGWFAHKYEWIGYIQLIVYVVLANISHWFRSKKQG